MAGMDAIWWRSLPTLPCAHHRGEDNLLPILGCRVGKAELAGIAATCIIRWRRGLACGHLQRPTPQI